MLLRADCSHLFQLSGTNLVLQCREVLMLRRQMLLVVLRGAHAVQGRPEARTQSRLHRRLLLQVYSVAYGAAEHCLARYVKKSGYGSNAQCCSLRSSQALTWKEKISQQQTYVDHKLQMRCHCREKHPRSTRNLAATHLRNEAQPRPRRVRVLRPAAEAAAAAVAVHAQQARVLLHLLLVLR